jgi:hypothetical protein
LPLPCRLSLAEPWPSRRIYRFHGLPPDEMPKQYGHAEEADNPSNPLRSYRFAILALARPHSDATPMRTGASVELFQHQAICAFGMRAQWCGRPIMRPYQRKWFVTFKSSRICPRVFYDLQPPRKQPFDTPASYTPGVGAELSAAIPVIFGLYRFLISVRGRVGMANLSEVGELAPGKPGPFYATCSAL